MLECSSITVCASRGLMMEYRYHYDKYPSLDSTGVINHGHFFMYPMGSVVAFSGSFAYVLCHHGRAGAAVGINPARPSPNFCT